MVVEISHMHCMNQEKKKQYNARQGVEGSILLQALIIYAFVYVYLLVQFYP